MALPLSSYRGIGARPRGVGRHPPAGRNPTQVAAGQYRIAKTSTTSPRNDSAKAARRSFNSSSCS